MFHLKDPNTNRKTPADLTNRRIANLDFISVIRIRALPTILSILAKVSPKTE